jgi:L-lactate dehydrogenase complex protein LldG
LTGTSAREEILGKISRALKSEAKSEANSESSRASGARASSDDARLALEIRSRCERTREHLIGQFESELVKVGVRVFHAATTESAAEYIEQIALKRVTRTIVAADTEVVESIGLQKRLGKNGISYVTETSDAEFRRTAIEAGIGVSGIDYALADTGTLVLLARKGHARSISLLPPVHVAIVKPDQIVSGLDDLFPLLQFEKGVNDLGSAVTFITGPSRTADIELTLVVGVHGPQELHVILLKN